MIRKACRTQVSSRTGLVKTCVMYCPEIFFLYLAMCEEVELVNFQTRKEKLKRYLTEQDHHDLHQRSVSERLRSSKLHYPLAVLVAGAHLQVCTRQILPTGNCRIKRNHSLLNCLVTLLTTHFSSCKRDQALSLSDLSHTYLKKPKNQQKDPNNSKN